jgi:hypothetical protein
MQMLIEILIELPTGSNVLAVTYFVSVARAPREPIDEYSKYR